MTATRCMVATFLVSCILAGGTVKAEPVVTLAQVELLLASTTSGIATEQLSVRLPVATAIVMNGTFSITSKGNGVLQVPGASIRIYDGHQDGLVFEGGLLNSEFVDMDKDGFRDIVLWGTAVLSDDEEKVTGRRPVLCIFRYDSATKRFVNTVPSRDVYVY